MALEFSTIGCTLKYCTETTAGTMPTSGFTTINNIVSIGGIEGTPDNLDCTDLSDEWRRYCTGVKDGGNDWQITANLTAAFKTAWEALVTAAETAKAANKATWFEIVFPGTLTSFYVAGDPIALGSPEIGVNEVLQITAHITPNEISGWAASST